MVIRVPEVQEMSRLPVFPGNGKAELDGVLQALRPAGSARDEFIAGFPVHRPQQAGAAHGDEEVRKVNRYFFGTALPLVRLERLEERVDLPASDAVPLHQGPETRGELPRPAERLPGRRRRLRGIEIFREPGIAEHLERQAAEDDRESRVAGPQAVDRPPVVRDDLGVRHAFQRPDRLLRLRETVPRERGQDEGQGEPPLPRRRDPGADRPRRREEPFARLVADVHPRRRGSREVPEERLRERGVGIARRGPAPRLLEGTSPAKDRRRRGGEEGEGEPHLHAAARTLPRSRLPMMPGQKHAAAPPTVSGRGSA